MAFGKANHRRLGSCTAIGCRVPSNNAAVLRVPLPDSGWRCINGVMSINAMRADFPRALTNSDRRAIG